MTGQETVPGGIFLDVVCPKCGRHCGNGGHGMTLRCQCGWTGGLDPHDAQLVAEFFKQHQERDAQASADRSKK